LGGEGSNCDSFCADAFRFLLVVLWFLLATRRGSSRACSSLSPCFFPEKVEKRQLLPCSAIAFRSRCLICCPHGAATCSLVDRPAIFDYCAAPPHPPSTPSYCLCCLFARIRGQLSGQGALMALEESCSPALSVRLPRLTSLFFLTRFLSFPKKLFCNPRPSSSKAEKAAIALPNALASGPCLSPPPPPFSLDTLSREPKKPELFVCI